MSSGISVVVCCYNSALRLTPTLRHLLAQKDIALSSWEVIVIDNASTDNTQQKAIDIWGNYVEEKPPFKVVFEREPGLSSARQRGIAEAAFDYVLFCDDDNWLDENYISISLKIMESNAEIGALGGTGYPVFEDKEPPYFWVNQYHLLAVGQQSIINGDITDERGVLYGAGMTVNKAAFNVLINTYHFDFLVTDRNGKNLNSSGDHELCLALRKIGYRIYYSKELKFKHFLPCIRTTISYYKKLFYGFGVSYVLLQAYRMSDKLVNDWKFNYRYLCLRCIKNIVVYQALLLIKGYYYKKEKLKYLDHVNVLHSNLGMLKTYLAVKNAYKKQFSELILFKNKIG
ncbi:MAG: glycosyltransferase [Ferruginibacter sp.]